MDIETFVKFKNLRWKNGAVRAHTGHVVSWKKIYIEFINSLEATETPPSERAFCQEVEGCVVDIQQQALNEFQENALFETVDSPDSLVEQAIDYIGFKICAKGEKVTREGVGMSFEKLETAIIHHNNHYRDASIGPDGKLSRPVWNTEVIRNTIKFFLDSRELETRKTLRDNLKYDPAWEKWSEDVLKGVFRAFSVKGRLDLVVSVFKQWIWQTKRYMNGLPVPSPIMINLMGSVQETGKTLFVRKLAGPLKDFYSECTLAQVSDTREAERWTSNYIVMFDELNLGNIGPQEFGRTMATFKYMLTANEINHRTMRTTKQSKSDRTFSPIATSNETMINVVYDPTGMRRFFEIELAAKVSQDRIKKLLGLEYAGIWKGINENLEKGYVYQGNELCSAMTEVQQSYKRKECLDWALQYIDYGNMPVQKLVHNDIHEAVTSADSIKKLKTVLKESNLVACTLPDMRKRVADWVKDEMGQDQVKWLPSGVRFLHALEMRGMWVYDIHGSDPRVICAPVMGESTEDEVGV